MSKLLIAILGVALMIPAGWALAGSLGNDRDDLAFTAGTTTTRVTTTDRDRRAGNAERGRRQRGRRAGTRREDRARVREAGEDVRGPCDEPEHRNDPRCTGTAGRDDDQSGPGGGGYDRSDDDHSGPGGGGNGRSDD
jgi:hypothetical protein